MLEKYGNLKQLSGQGTTQYIILCVVYIYILLIYFAGIEKNNDSKWHYFSSNKHDAPGEIIRSECRQEALQHGVWDHPSCVRNILNEMTSTGQEVVFKRSENEPEKTT